MRSAIRLLAVPVLVGSVVAGVALGPSGDASAASPRVVIVDNDAPLPSDGIDPRTAEWSFAPYHTTVTKGEAVTFSNPAGNFRPHDVVSFTRGGTFQQPTWDVGAQFNSGTTGDTWLRPAGSTRPNSSEPAPSSWQLDSGTLDAGHYTYICTLHPWMTGTITVLPAQ